MNGSYFLLLCFRSLVVADLIVVSETVHVVSYAFWSGCYIIIYFTSSPPALMLATCRHSEQRMHDGPPSQARSAFPLKQAAKVSMRATDTALGQSCDDVAFVGSLSTRTCCLLVSYCIVVLFASIFKWS